MDWATITVAELVWVAITADGVRYHTIMYRRIRADIALMDAPEVAGVLQPSAAARYAFRADRVRERDWIVVKTFLFLAGVVALLRDNPNPNWLGWVQVALLLGAVAYARWSSYTSGRKRRDYVANHPLSEEQAAANGDGS